MTSTADYLASINAAFATLDPLPVWPTYTDAWVGEALELQKQIASFQNNFPAACCDWKHRVDSHGHAYLLGRLWLPKRSHGFRLVCTHHRIPFVVYQLAFTHIPPGHKPVQTCKNLKCWNPGHLSLVPTRQPFKTFRKYAF